MQIVTLIGSVITGTAGFGAAWRCTPCMHMLLIFQPAQELSSTVHAESAPMSRVQHDRCVLPPVSVHTGVYLEGALCSENSPAFTALVATGACVGQIGADNHLPALRALHSPSPPHVENQLLTSCAVILAAYALGGNIPPCFPHCHQQY